MSELVGVASRVQAWLVYGKDVKCSVKEMRSVGGDGIGVEGSDRREWQLSEGTFWSGSKYAEHRNKG